MSNTLGASVQTARRTGSQLVNRTTLGALVTLTMLFGSARTSSAQDSVPQPKAWEFRFASGALVATGNQRNSLKDARLTAAQASWLLRPSLAITGTFGWAASRDLGSVGTEKLDVFSSDLGVEVRPAELFSGRKMTFSPFAGVGAGARSYNYRKLDVDATNNVAAYASVGGEIGISRVGLRVEVRDYATGFKPLVGVGNSDTRNDVVIMAAVRFNRHRASKIQARS